MSYPTLLASRTLRLLASLLAGFLTLVFFATSARAQATVDLTPPTGTLFDPGDKLYWNTKAYDVTFSSPMPISGVDWKINLATNQTIAVRIYSASKALIVTGTPAAGAGVEQFVRAPVTFTPTVGVHYWIGLYCSDANAIFPRKDLATYPFTVGSVTVNNHQSAAGDVAPADNNTWAPFFRLVGTIAGPALSLNPPTITFPNQAAGSVSAPTPVTITNTGTAVLDIMSSALTGPYQVMGLGPAALAPGAMVSFNVRFAPTASGAAPGNLKIVSDDPSSPATLTLNGTGVAPVIGLAPTNVPFAPQRVGSTSGRQIVTISNQGTVPLTITNVIVGGANGPDFGLVLPALPTMLAPMESIAFGVTFTPSTTGARNASVTVQSNDPANPSAAVTLSGTGTSPAVGVAPMSLDFGGVQLATGKALPVVITNSGDAALTIKSVQTTGATAFTLLMPPALPVTLAPGAMLTLSVVYSPVTVTMDNGMLTLGTDLPVNPNLIVPLTGTGLSGILAVTPLQIDFANVVVGATSMASDVVVTNTGNDPFNITAAAVTGATPAQFPLTLPALPALLAPRATATFKVAFAPNTAAPFTGKLHLLSDLVGEIGVDINLTGSGVQDGIVVATSGTDASAPTGDAGVAANDAEASDAGTDNGAPPEATATIKGGCGCRMIASERTPMVGILGIGLAVFFAASRRRRRPQNRGKEATRDPESGAA